MTTSAMKTLEDAQSRYSDLSVGDKVLATYDNGSTFVACRVYEIEENKVSFLWGQIVFSCEIELAAMSTVLIEKFNRADVIAEILSMVA